ncbi:breast cancer anti-estrogen resistance protein 1-like protein, partial [Leptotrombidium deliense]
VVTPQKLGDVYLYDVPTTTGVTYDVPVSRQLRSSNSSPLPNQVSHSMSQSKASEYTYDTPQSPKIIKSNDHGFTAMINDKIVSQSLDENITKLGGIEAYDIPVSVRRMIVNGEQNDNCSYDVPPPPTTKVVESESEVCYDVPRSNRSSGIISHVSSNSSLFSPSPQSNCSSLAASTSFSSLGDSNRSSFEKPASEIYDVPPSGNPRRVLLSTDVSYHDSKRNSLTNSKGTTVNLTDTSLSNGCRNSINKDEESTLHNSLVYDLPKTLSSTNIETARLSHEIKRLSISSNDSKESATYSILTSDTAKELNVDAAEGIALMVKHQQDVLNSSNDLFALITEPNWRQKERLSSNIINLQNCCRKLSGALQELVEFSNRVFINSMNASDRTLSQRLSKVLLQIVNSNAIIQNSVASVDAKGWTTDRLALILSRSPTDNCKTPDELDQLIACSRGLTEDIKHITSFIHGNAKYLFKDSRKKAEKPTVLPKPIHLRALPSIPPPAPPRNANVQSRPLPPLPKESASTVAPIKVELRENSPESVVTNDYEYVSLESKESVSRNGVTDSKKSQDLFEGKIVKEKQELEFYSLPHSSAISDSDVFTYGRLCDATSLQTVDSFHIQHLSASDRQVLLFYCAQIENHKCVLSNSIEAFVAAINQNQPPKVFIERSKLVVVAALKMIYISDTISRNVNSELSFTVSKCCNCLCEHLKTLVMSTKKAAIQFPSVTAVQEMVDSVVDVSNAANKLFTSLMKSSTL